MAEAPHPHAATEHENLHHEESDVNFGAILAFGAGLVVVCIAAALIVFVMFKFFEAHEAHSVPVEYPLAAGQGDRVPPEPRLQTNPRDDLRELRAKEDELLGSYGWVDKNAGIVRIPIDTAMKLTVERGLAARPQEKP